MSHFVPDFDTDDDYVNVSCSKFPRKPIIGEEEEDLMELLWHNGQVVVQNQRLNNNNVKKQPSSSSSSAAVKGGGEAAPPQPLQPLDNNLFIQEDEMTSWLQYPDLRDDDFCSDLLFPAAAPPTSNDQVTAAPPTSNDQVTAARPPVPPSVRPPVRNFMNFSRLRGDFTGRGECGPSKGKAAVATVSENPGASSSSAVASKNEILDTGKTIVDDRKRKETEEAIDDETEYRNEQAKQGRGSTSTKRSRAAQVHNLSERKRRDRINERMKALQELIPRCNKSDKASMLDEAIEYMKSLQLQIQMMSMGCGMMPMMYTGMQQYMPHMGMGMGMGMEMGMNRPPPPFMPFPNMLASQRPLPALTRIGGYPVHASDPSRVYVSNQQFDPNSNQAQYSGYMDPYHQFRSLHPSQPPQFQNQATSYPSSSRVSSSKESEDQGNKTTS